VGAAPMHMAAIVRGGPLPVGSSWNLGAHFLDTTPKATQSYAQILDSCLPRILAQVHREESQADEQHSGAEMPLRNSLEVCRTTPGEADE